MVLYAHLQGLIDGAPRTSAWLVTPQMQAPLDLLLPRLSTTWFVEWHALMAPGALANLIIFHAAVVALQGDPEGNMLLHGVREEDLERERQQLAWVRLPLLHGPAMLQVLACMGAIRQGRCELRICVEGKRSKSSDAGHVRVW